MVYEAFSRKYRPRTFSEVIGQDYVVKTLKNAIKLSRISHAYIFAGSRGIGKTTIARIFTKALNCRSPLDFEPCNQCENCLEIEKGSFPDMYEIDAASNRGIDDIRSIRDNVNYSPIKGSYKVYIIDEAHMLTKEAFNALLKTMEEPPPRNIFILATTEFYKIPDTIKSRCQIFLFKPPTKPQIKQYLKRILEKESVEYEEEALELLVEEAEGGMRDFASLLDQIVTFSEGKLTKKAVEEILGIVPEKYVKHILTAIKNMKLEEGVKTLELLETEGYDINVLWKQLTDELYQELIEISLKGKGETFSQEEEKKLIYILSIFNKAATESRNFQNPKNVYQLYLLKLRYLEYIRPIEELLSVGTYKGSKPHKVDSVEGYSKVESHQEPVKPVEEIYRSLKREPVLANLLTKFEVEISPDLVVFKAKEVEAGEYFQEKKSVIEKILGKNIEIVIPKEKSQQKRSGKRDESIDRILELFPGSKILKYENRED